LPEDVKHRYILLLDPMLATGRTASKAIEVILEHGVPEEHIIFLTIVSAKEGLQYILSKFPKIRIITVEIDPELNAQQFIMPGLGNFSSRYFGTDGKK
jgi:uracil phosphoribosyltransferase